MHARTLTQAIVHHRRPEIDSVEKQSWKPNWPNVLLQISSHERNSPDLKANVWKGQRTFWTHGLWAAQGLARLNRSPFSKRMARQSEQLFSSIPVALGERTVPQNIVIDMSESRTCTSTRLNCERKCHRQTCHSFYTGFFYFKLCEWWGKVR